MSFNWGLKNECERMHMWLANTFTYQFETNLLSLYCGSFSHSISIHFTVFQYPALDALSLQSGISQLSFRSKPRPGHRQSRPTPHTNVQAFVNCIVCYSFGIMNLQCTFSEQLLTHFHIYNSLCNINKQKLCLSNS